MTTNFSQTAAYIWSLADLLRGDFRQSQYGRIILPFTILRRLECVLEATKLKVLAQVEKLKDNKKLEEEAREKFLLKAAKQSFYNTSPMNMSLLGSADIKDNLVKYIECFSRDAREIFEHFKFSEFIAQLQDANLLYKVVQKVAQTDLSPEVISNHDMGLVFEELIRRFAESSNDTAGEHFTPRDIVRLTTSLVFMEDDDALTEPGIIRTINDCTAGTGGFLSSGMEYVHELNPEAVMRAFGQELNPESYAICKGDMLIKGQDVSRIKLGNTLSDDQLYGHKFDYSLANPPFGVDWKKVEGPVKDEHTLKGFDGRFGPGLPRVSDGSLLFLMHLISKMRDYDGEDLAHASGCQADGNPKRERGRNGNPKRERVTQNNGGRIGIILNGSPLFTGGAGSGESEIRRHILESDLLEAIVALPTDMFYNTGIATYVWILSNKKEAQRRGKVQLINGVHLYQKMRKSLGSKRQQLGEEDIKLITQTFGNFEAVESYRLDKDHNENPTRKRGTTSRKKADRKTFGSKIFASHEFGYRRITIERPLRLSVQFTNERLETLRFESGKLNAAMQKIYEQFGEMWNGSPTLKRGTASPDKFLADASGYHAYGELSTVEAEVRAMVKADFPDLKEKDIKDLLAPKTWTATKELLNKAMMLQSAIGTDQHDDFNQFETTLKQAITDTGVELDAKQKKQILAAVSWTNPDAEPVIKKILKTRRASRAKMETRSASKAKMETRSVSKAKTETLSLSQAKMETRSASQAKMETRSVSEAKIETRSLSKAKMETRRVSEAKIETRSLSKENSVSEDKNADLADASGYNSDRTYGTFEYRKQVVQFQPDSDLRDNEDVPLTAETARGFNVDSVNEAYFHKEVAPHVPDAWIDNGKCDARDGGVGIVGYEIPFNRHFYEYEPPRPLQEIDAELDELSGEIMEMLQEVHS